MHPGKRDVLIDLFDREFIESQEVLGIRIIGQFRDLDNPDRFVWLRGFPDMAARAEGLQAFYGGPVWKAHRDAANATMIDSDNVLLLRPARATSGFQLDDGHRPPAEMINSPDGIVIATIYYFNAPVGEIATLRYCLTLSLRTARTLFLHCRCVKVSRFSCGSRALQI